jgi:hypothetical protein
MTAPRPQDRTPTSSGPLSRQLEYLDLEQARIYLAGVEAKRPDFADGRRAATAEP